MVSRKTQPAASARSATKKQSVAERFVLLIGDEGAVFIHIKNNTVVARHYSPAPDAPETAALGEIVRRSPEVPLLPVLDTLDQAYIAQTLPPVSAMNVKKLMAKRTQREFAGNYLSGALLMGRDKAGRKEWQFMMAAVERAGPVAAWLSVVFQWPNPCPGIYLLPMESIATISRLRTTLDKTGPMLSGDAWQLLVSYNKVSGLRQVICHNDQLVLTRLGQLTLESTPETIAGTIEQEVIGTQEYLRRLSSDEDQALDVFIIIPEEMQRHIDPSRLRARRVYLMTPHEVGTALELREATQPADRFGDVVLSTAVGMQSKHRLALLTPELQGVRKIYQAIIGQRIVAIFMGLALIGFIGLCSVNAFDVYQKTSDLDGILTRQQKALQVLQNKSEQQPEKLDRIINVVSLYQRLRDESYTPEPLLTRISAKLPDTVRVTELSWQLPDSNAKSPSTDTAIPTSNTELIVEFPLSLAKDRVHLQQLMTDTLNGLKADLVGYDISYTAMPDLVNDTKPLTIDLNDVAKKGPENIAAPVAHILIKGPWKPGEPAKTTATPATPATPAAPEAPNAASR